MNISLQPRITIVMPAYNAEKYIETAILSILGQTFKEFILMIINDGSTDSTEHIIRSFKDPRIQYIKNDENIGLVRTLNKSIDLTETEYYARMDADDISFEQRLQWQLDFMDKHKNVHVCGGSFDIMEHGKKRKSAVLLENNEIKASLLFACHICHPTVMIRTLVLKENNVRFGVPFNYKDTYGHKILELEDFALWHKLKSIAIFKNLEQVVITYRQEGQNLSSQKKDLILERKKTFYSYYLNELHIKPSEKNLLFHITLSNFSLSQHVSDIQFFKEHLENIKGANKKIKIYPIDALDKIIEEKWEQLFYYVVPKGLTYVSFYWKQSGKITISQFNYFLKFSIKKVFNKK